MPSRHARWGWLRASSLSLGFLSVMPGRIVEIGGGVKGDGRGVSVRLERRSPPFVIPAEGAERHATLHVIQLASFVLFFAPLRLCVKSEKSHAKTQRREEGKSRVPASAGMTGGVSGFIGACFDCGDFWRGAPCSSRCGRIKSATNRRPICRCSPAKAGVRRAGVWAPAFAGERLPGRRGTIADRVRGS